jgi:hypothetical protein
MKNDKNTIYYHLLIQLTNETSLINVLKISQRYEVPKVSKTLPQTLLFIFPLK